MKEIFDEYIEFRFYGIREQDDFKLKEFEVNLKTGDSIQ